jgi:Flp pilus assembly protein TadB
MSPALAAAAIAALALVTGAGLLVPLVAARRRQAVLDRRIGRIVALFPGRGETPEGGPDEALIMRSRRRRLRPLIEARYPLVDPRTALPKAAAVGLAGAAAAAAACWLLRVPFGWWTPALLAVAGAAAAWLSLARFQRQAAEAFTAKFPELVDQIVRLSATGVPVVEAVGSVTEHAPHPVKPVLTEFSDQLTAGIDPDEAARTVARRFPIPELVMFLAVIRLQRRSGGGVSAAFSNLSKTLRDRRQTGLKAKASTAQTRFTLLILAVLPFVLLLAQNFTSPDSIDMLFNTDTGTLLLRWGFALIAGGLWVARSIAAGAVR